MARRRKSEEIDIKPPIELSEEGKVAYATYWTALANNGDLAETQSFNRAVRGQGPSTAFKYPNILNAQKPFQRKGGYISACEVLELCNSVYWHPGFALWRRMVEIQVELCNTTIILKKSSQKTRDFFEQWFKSIGIEKFKEQWYRERFRSCNVFVQKLNGTINPDDLRQLNSLYNGIDESLPLRYLILEPSRIRALETLNYQTPIYYREFSADEVKKLRNPETPEEKAIVEALPEKTKETLKRSNTVILPIDPKNLIVMISGNQPYEPFGVPMVWNAIQNVELKLALQNMDKIIASMGERLFLLVNVGIPNDEHNKVGINYNVMTQLQQMFNSGAVQRAIVADFSVKMQWISLPINELLSSEKYKEVDKDLMIALNGIIFDAAEKFANTSVKVNIFVETLREARDEFLVFLQREIDAVSKKINAKSAPEASFSDIDLRDKNQFEKFVQSMASVGLLTAKEVWDALETGKMPSDEESVENQRAFMALKEEGLYAPLVGNSVQQSYEQMDINKELGIQQIQQKEQQAKMGGRPSGSKGPRKVTKVGPVGASLYEPQIDFERIKEVSWSVSKLQNKIEKKVLNLFGTNELNEESKKSCMDFAIKIIADEPEENWVKSIKSYFIKATDNKTPEPISAGAQEEIDDIKNFFGVNDYNAAIIRLCLTRE